MWELLVNYTNGDNEISDQTINVDNILPFAVYNAGVQNPDLIYELNKHFEILFEDQKSSNTYMGMMNRIASIASEARNIGNHGENTAKAYLAMKKCEYEYLNVLKSYIPKLLEKEEFFTAVFR